MQKLSVERQELQSVQMLELGMPSDSPSAPGLRDSLERAHRDATEQRSAAFAANEELRAACAAVGGAADDLGARGRIRRRQGESGRAAQAASEREGGIGSPEAERAIAAFSLARQEAAAKAGEADAARAERDLMRSQQLASAASALRPAASSQEMEAAHAMQARRCSAVRRRRRRCVRRRSLSASAVVLVAARRQMQQQQQQQVVAPSNDMELASLRSQVERSASEIRSARSELSAARHLPRSSEQPQKQRMRICVRRVVRPSRYRR